MSPLTALTLAVLALSPASGAPRKAPGDGATPATAAATPPSAVEALRAAAKGAPLLLVLTDKGAVEARTPDGAFTHVVTKGPIDDAAWDGRRELLWLRKKDAIEVLDLREGKPKAVRIAERVPPGKLVVSWGKESVYSSTGGPELVFVGLAWDGKPTLRGSPAPLEMDETVIAAFDASMAEAAFVGAEWIEGASGRPDRAVPESRWLGPERKVQLPADVSCVDDANWPLCGAATELGPWLLVAERVSCGDACWAECRLYDPAANTPLAADPRRAAPASLARANSCGPYELEPTGAWYLFPEGFEDVACAFAGGCHTLRGHALGWLDPGAKVGTDSLY